MIELNRIYNEDCLEGMKLLDDNSIDSIVTDPPYEIGFMGKKWDNTGIAYNIELWKECLRILKPGGHLLAFGGTRTYHRMACAIEDAGFEIRDCIQWLYGSGFPKSMDISKAIDKQAGAKRPLSDIQRPIGGKNGVYEGQGGNWGETSNVPITPEAQQWGGWGTALKPANEPIVLARKPISEKTIAENVLKWGTGGLNIDGCRIPTDPTVDDHRLGGEGSWKTDKAAKNVYEGGYAGENIQSSALGRFPANVILDEEAGELLDEQSGKVSYGNKSGGYSYTGASYEVEGFVKNCKPQASSNYGDSGGASRFFYCAKASKKERNMGLEDVEPTTVDDGRNKPIDNPFLRGKTPRQNTHPTVKPIKLMEYLITLITPPGGVVLDPFFGSGTTGIACVNLGYGYVGIELDKHYCDIANERIQKAMQEEMEEPQK